MTSRHNIWHVNIIIWRIYINISNCQTIMSICQKIVSTGMTVKDIKHAIKQYIKQIVAAFESFLVVVGPMREFKINQDVKTEYIWPLGFDLSDTYIILLQMKNGNFRFPETAIITLCLYSQISSIIREHWQNNAFDWNIAILTTIFSISR